MADFNRAVFWDVTDAHIVSADGVVQPIGLASADGVVMPLSDEEPITIDVLGVLMGYTISVGTFSMSSAEAWDWWAFFARPEQLAFAYAPGWNRHINALNRRNQSMFFTMPRTPIWEQDS
jgi:hypothetical protein